MTAQGLDQPWPIRHPHRSTQHLELSSPYLEHLSIAELERLLAEKRRRESTRILRAAAGRAAASAARGPATPASLTGSASARRGTPTRRLLPEETRGGADAPPPTPARPAAGPPVDRFRRAALAGPARPPVVSRPARIREATVRRTIDLGLQITEICLVLLFVYVIAQWLFADAQTDTNIAAEMAAVAVPTATAVASPPAIDPAAALAPLAAAVATAGVPPGIVPAAAMYDPVGQAQGPVWPALPLYTPPAGPTVADDAAGPPRTWAQVPGALLPRPFAGSPVRAAATPTAAPTATPVDPAWPTAIRIPKIKLDARVREVQVDLVNWQWEVADFMAGHHSGTANPGQTGNVVIAGHRDIRGSVFLHLDQLKKGDDIYISTGRGDFHYVVRAIKIVLPTASEVMAPTTDQRLTLITCTPVKIASHRLVVIAELDPHYKGSTSGH